MKNFLAGLGLGAGLGMLFAPKAGSETRNKLMQGFDEMMEHMNHSAGALKQAGREQMQHPDESLHAESKPEMAEARASAHEDSRQSSDGDSDALIEILNNASKTKLIERFGDWRCDRAPHHRAPSL